MLALFLTAILCAIAITSSAIYICDAGDPAFLGNYSPSAETLDGVPIFTNANDMSFFRNKNHWYLGNLGPWPPETHYRCVQHDGCNFGASTPPTSAEGQWTAAKRFGKDPVPAIKNEPCATSSEEL